MEPSYLGTTQTPIGPVTENERMLAVLSHALTLVAWIFAPLIIYLLKKEESPFVRDHSKESLNFQLTLLIAYFIGFLLTIVVIGILLLAVIGFVQLVLVIVATIKAADNQLYRYPFTIRFIR
jgi:uncharacterized Tic20 family protein